MLTREKIAANPHDEEILIRKAKETPEAFKPLYEKYFKRIFLFVLHRVGEKSLAADLTAQVFLKAMTNLNKFKVRGAPFSAWLFRIALNECHDFFRKANRYRMVTVDDEAVAHLHEELTSGTGMEDLVAKLPAILSKLSTDELQLIELRFFERRPFKEISDIVGISETYAKVRVYRILGKMKNLFMSTTGGRQAP